MLLLLLTACTPERRAPGGELIGTFALRAAQHSMACELDEVSGEPFDVDVTLSRDAESGEAWLTLNGTSRAGAWDGQRFQSSASARRVFPSRCSECTTSLEEAMTLVVLSRSQSEALGNRCPENALDGGVPEPDDAGLVRPSMTRLGFDAVGACGEVSTRVRASGLLDGGPCAPECDSCVVRYQVAGARR